MTPKFKVGDVLSYKTYSYTYILQITEVLNRQYKFIWIEYGADQKRARECDTGDVTAIDCNYTEDYSHIQKLFNQDLKQLLEE